MSSPSLIVSVLRAVRPHEWVKNLLVFAPLVAAHRARETDLLLRAMLAFVAFSLCASSVYVVLALYLSSDHVTTLYAHPRRLWLLCPLALCWTGRLWFLANRGVVHEDPVVFALKDRVSWAVLLGAATVVVAAS